MLISASTNWASAKPPSWSWPRNLFLNESYGIALGWNFRAKGPASYLIRDVRLDGMSKQDMGDNRL
jgi:hypothetical protein